jgi:peroxiredoxin
MRKEFSLLFLILVSFLPVFGKGYRITVKLDSARDKQVFLAHYYGANIYVDDTIKTDGAGVGVFRRDSLLPQGLYKIYLDKDNHFDFLLGSEQVLTIKNPAFTIDKLEIDGSKESFEFQVYVKWLKKKQEERAQLDSVVLKATGEEKKKIELKISEITDEVTAYWMQKAKQYHGTLFATFLMANYFRDLKPEDIPAEYAGNDSLKWVYQYNYRKNHFFDYFDFSDQRLLYMPIIKSKLDIYFEKVLLQLYDSVKPAAYQIIAKVEPYPQMFRFVIPYLLNNSLTSRIMGMDALFVDIAQDYYLSGKTHWADSTTLAKIRENVIFMEHNLIGNNAPDFKMETFDGQPFRLYQQNSKYTILAFFEPSCSHCKEYMPRLYKEVYIPFRDKGLEVIAGYTMNNKKEWGDFLEKNQMTDWINVWDENDLSRFKIIYDTRTTPSVYLLDKEKKIIAKKVTIEYLKDYLGYFLDDKGK